MFHQGAMTENQLPDPTRQHVDQDLLTRYDFVSGFHKISIHIVLKQATGGSADDGLVPNRYPPGIAAEKLLLLSLFIGKLQPMSRRSRKEGQRVQSLNGESAYRPSQFRISRIRIGYNAHHLK